MALGRAGLWAGTRAVFVLVVAGCGAASSSPVAGGLETVEPVDVECSTSSRDHVRTLVTRQELSFDGTVTAISAERNVYAGYQRALVDDGEESPGELPDDHEVLEPDPDDPTAGEVWPWTTFEVHGWYTSDHGSEISIWTAGLELDIGERWLIAGEAFATPDGLGDHDAQSGMAAACAGEPYSEATAPEWDEWFGGTVLPGVAQPEGEPRPAAVEEIEAGRTRWNESGTSTYTATMRVYPPSGDDGAPCSAVGTSVRLVVEDGVVTDAVNLDQGCRIDTNAVFTIDDLFDLAITASAAADEHGYEIDPTWGFPRSFYGYDRSLEVDGFVGSFAPRATRSLVDDEIRQSIDEFRSQWAAAGIGDYRFAIEWGCFCPPEVVGPFLITVANGEQDSITRADGGHIDPNLMPDLPSTIEQFFDLIESEVSSNDLVVAGFDEELGFPTDLFVDAIQNATDDELTVLLTDFEPT